MAETRTRSARLGGAEPDGEDPRVTVGPSRIAGAGLGVFALRDFARGELVTEYCGDVVGRREALARPRSHMRTLLAHFLYIDGARRPPPRGSDAWGGGVGSLANDGRDLLNNTEYVHRTDRATARPRIFLRATRAIEAGDEVLVSYGRAYWSQSSSQSSSLVASESLRCSSHTAAANSCSSRASLQHMHSSFP